MLPRRFGAANLSETCSENRSDDFDSTAVSKLSDEHFPRDKIQASNERMGGSYRVSFNSQGMDSFWHLRIA